MVWWCDGSGRIQLNITKDQARSGSHQGECHDDVEALMQVPAIRRQLNKIEPGPLARVIAEYTDWDVSDHQTNLNRILWIACGDINDNTIAADYLGTSVETVCLQIRDKTITETCYPGDNYSVHYGWDSDHSTMLIKIIPLGGDRTGQDANQSR
jgi:hypothetical protein